MKNPQLENGYCSFAIEIIEQFCKYRLSGEEWLVLWAIFRKTYCWHKKEDKIAISTFAVMTGLKRPTVQRALRKLESKKIIDNIKNDTRQPNLYRFNKHFDTWKIVSKKMPLASKKILPVIKNDTILESKKRHSIDTKDTLSKERRFTPPSLSEVNEYIKLNQYNVDGEQWLNFYESKGWQVGKNKMKNWQAGVRTWAKRNKVTQTVLSKEQEARNLVKECETKYGMEQGAEIAMFRFAKKYGDQSMLEFKGIFKL